MSDCPLCFQENGTNRLCEECDTHAIRTERDAALARVAELNETIDEIARRLHRCWGGDPDAEIEECERIARAALAKGKTK